MKYGFMEKHAKDFRIVLMVRVLCVSRRGFYAWRERTEPGPRQRARTAMDVVVKQAFAARKGRSGTPRLTRDLHEDGHPYNRKSEASSLRRQGLRAKAARRFKATTNSKHNLPMAANLLEQDLSAEGANGKWVGDITYFR